MTDWGLTPIRQNRLKMKTKVGTFLLSLLLASVSCTESYQDQYKKGLDSIDKVDAHFISAYSDSIDIVILDNDTVNALLGNVTKVLYDDGHYFISHKTQSNINDIKQLIAVFNGDGEFECQIGRFGRARNEFNGFRGWALDPVNNEVLICDFYRSRILRYKYDGTFAGDLEYSELLDANQLFHAGGNLYLQVLIPNDKGLDDIAVLSDDGKFRNVIKDRKIQTEIFMMPGIRELSGSSSDTIYHVRSFDNCLYALYDGAVAKKIPIPFMPSLSAEDSKRINMDSKIMEYIPSYGIDTNDYYFLSLSGEKYRMFVYEKRNRKWIGYTNSTSNLDFILPSKFVGSTDKNAIIGVIDASLARNLLESKANYSSADRAKLKAISNSENPSLLIYHLR